MLICAGLPSNLCPETILTAYYITNHLPTKALNIKILYKAWYIKKLNLSNHFIYGCNAYIVDYHAKSKQKMA